MKLKDALQDVPFSEMEEIPVSCFARDKRGNSVPSYPYPIDSKELKKELDFSE